MFNLTLFCDWILPNSASFLGGSSCLFSHGQTLQLIDPPNHRLASKFSLFVTRNSWVIENPKDVLVSICLHTFAGHILIKRLLLKSQVFAGQIHISYQFHPCSPQKTFFAYKSSIIQLKANFRWQNPVKSRKQPNVHH